MSRYSPPSPPTDSENDALTCSAMLFVFLLSFVALLFKAAGVI